MIFFQCLRYSRLKIFLKKLSPVLVCHLTWDVHALVFDADGMDSHLLGDKLDAVVSFLDLHDLAQLCDTRRTRHRRLHVIHLRSCNIAMDTVEYIPILVPEC